MGLSGRDHMRSKSEAKLRHIHRDSVLLVSSFKIRAQTKTRRVKGLAGLPVVGHLVDYIVGSGETRIAPMLCKRGDGCGLPCDGSNSRGYHEDDGRSCDIFFSLI